MAASVESAGGYITLSNGTLFSAAAWTFVIAYKRTLAGATSTFRASAGLSNQTQNKMVWEQYQNEATDQQLFHKGSNGATNVDDQIENTDDPVGWRHLAITADSDGNPMEVYYIAEGFNQGSPSYIYRDTDTTDGIYNHAGDTHLLGIWHDSKAGEDQGNGIRVAHVVVYASALNEAAILAQFKSRAPTSASPAIYYPCTASASVGTDSSGNGRDATVTGSFTDVADEPSDWAVAVDSLPMSAFASQRINRDTLLRL